LTSGSCEKAGRLRRSMLEARERQIPARMSSDDVFFIETSMGRIPIFYQKAEKYFRRVRK
jgi:hypothetical protein